MHVVINSISTIRDLLYTLTIIDDHAVMSAWPPVLSPPPVACNSTFLRFSAFRCRRQPAGRGCMAGSTTALLQCQCGSQFHRLSWWRSIVVRTPVLAGELSLSCARLMAGRVTTLWGGVRYQSTNMANSASHPSGVG